MAHQLTETAAWANTVTVPDAADDGATRHVAAEVQVQALANRTQYLRTRVDAALPAAGGTVGGNLTISGDLTVGDDASVTGDLAVTGRVTSDEVLAGEGEFGQLRGTIVDIAGTIDAGGSITTEQNIRLPGDWRVLYTGTDADRRRLIRLRIASATSSQPTNMQFTGVAWLSANAYVLSVPLPQLPNYSVIEGVWVRGTSTNGTATCELIRMAIGDWGITGGTVPSATAIGSASLTQGGGVKTATISLSETVANASNDYWLRITGPASASHTIYGAYLQVRLYSPGID